MKTNWVAPNCGSTILDLDALLATYSDQNIVWKARERLEQLRAEFAWGTRTNLSISSTGDVELYDIARIEYVTVGEPPVPCVEPGANRPLAGARNRRE